MPPRPGPFLCPVAMLVTTPQTSPNLFQNYAKASAKPVETFPSLSHTCVEIHAKPARPCLQPAQTFVKTNSFCDLLLLNLPKPVPNLCENQG